MTSVSSASRRFRFRRNIPLAAFDRSGVVRVAWAIDYVCYPVCCGHFCCRARWGDLSHQVRLVIVKHIHMLPRIWSRDETWAGIPIPITP